MLGGIKLKHSRKKDRDMLLPNLLRRDLASNDITALSRGVFDNLRVLEEL